MDLNPRWNAHPLETARGNDSYHGRRCWPKQLGGVLYESSRWLLKESQAGSAT